jgi:glycine/D-amino acid oxidase-like deaminating enzyme
MADATPDPSGGECRNGVAWSELSTPGPTLPALAGPEETEVAVVGLGGTGLAALRELRERGVDAVGIDAGGVAAGAAGRNGGFLLAGLAAFHHDATARWGRERAVRCYRATLVALEEICDETPSAVRRTGSVRLAESDAELWDCRAQHSAMETDHLPVEWWVGPQGEGLSFPFDAAFQPVERCNQLAAGLLEAGTRLFGRSPVTEVRPAGLSTDGGSIACRTVLVCVDGGLEHLVPELAGVVRSARLQMLGTEPTVREVAPCPLYSRYGYDYWQQLPTGEVVLGGARDRGGDGEWTTEPVVSAEVQQALDRLLERVAGRDHPAVAWRWAGIVAYTASRLPVIRRLRSGVFVAGGYSGTGNVIGKLAGEALVELALDGSSELADLFDGPDGR